MPMSTAALVQSLQRLAGAANVRPASAAERVAGVQPQVFVEPERDEQVAAVLAFANAEHLAVAPRGGGTHLGVGAPPTAAVILLSTLRLNRILEHAPHDQTVSVEAGLPLTQLQAALARTDQWLALDPVAGPATTIGGLVSVNASGARRLRYGALRDQCIGLRVVLADGTIAKGGGKVVKNVAGYDLPKLYIGALGTLGVVVAATFRLYPQLKASQTTLFPAATLGALAEFSLRISASTVVPTAIDLFPAPTGGYILAVRIESSVAQAMTDQTETLLTLANIAPDETARVQRLSGAAEEQFWLAADALLRSTGDSATRDSLLLKASLLPSTVARWVTALDAEAQRQPLTARWRAHSGHGIVWARLEASAGSVATGVWAAIVTRMRAAAVAEGGTMVAFDASPSLAGAVDIWGAVPGGALMRRVKAQFDPQAILNPGRFVEGM